MKPKTSVTAKENLVDQLVTAETVDFCVYLSITTTEGIKEAIPELQKRNENEKVEIARFFLSRRALEKMERRIIKQQPVRFFTNEFPPCIHFWANLYKIHEKLAKISMQHRSLGQFLQLPRNEAARTHWRLQNFTPKGTKK